MTVMQYPPPPDHYSEARVVQRLRKARYLVGRPKFYSGPACYVAGPMTHLPEFNIHSFKKATDILREAGWIVISPVELDAEVGYFWDGTDGSPEFLKARGFEMWQAMARDLPVVCRVDAVFFLPGWEESVGALAEKHVAEKVGTLCLSYPGVRPC